MHLKYVGHCELWYQMMLKENWTWRVTNSRAHRGQVDRRNEQNRLGGENWNMAGGSSQVSASHGQANHIRPHLLGLQMTAEMGIFVWHILILNGWHFLINLWFTFWSPNLERFCVPNHSWDANRIDLIKQDRWDSEKDKSPDGQESPPPVLRSQSC